MLQNSKNSKNLKEIKGENMKKVEFSKNEPDVKLLAIYLAQLTREGVEYHVENRENKYDVIIKGF